MELWVAFGFGAAVGALIGYLLGRQKQVPAGSRARPAPPSQPPPSSKSFTASPDVKHVVLDEGSANVLNALNNRLAAIGALADLLHGSPLDPERARALMMLHGEVRRAAEITQHFLELAQHPIGAAEPSDCSIVLNGVLAERERGGDRGRPGARAGPVVRGNAAPAPGARRRRRGRRDAPKKRARAAGACHRCHTVAPQAAHPRGGRRRREPPGDATAAGARRSRGGGGRKRPRSDRAARARQRPVRRGGNRPADATARRSRAVRAAARAAPPPGPALRLRDRRPRARRDAPLPRGVRPARGDEALRLQRPDQRDWEGGGEGGLTTSGSYASRMPNCFSTPSRTSSASASKSALEPPRFTSANA